MDYQFDHSNAWFQFKLNDQICKVYRVSKLFRFTYEIITSSLLNWHLFEGKELMIYCFLMSHFIEQSLNENRFREIHIASDGVMKLKQIHEIYFESFTAVLYHIEKGNLLNVTQMRKKWDKLQVFDWKFQKNIDQASDAVIFKI